MYHFLTEQDFHWVTTQLCDITTSRGGRVLSVLEGGYSLSSPLSKPSKKTEVSANIPKRETRSAQASRSDRDATERNATNPVQVDEDDTPCQSLLATLPGDGGLVKGVMAHVAALAGRDNWLS